MNLHTTAILLASRPHGETAAIAKFLTPGDGLVAAYVAGGRGRRLRPVLIPGNVVDAEVRAKSDTQLPFARIELTTSRAPWMSEPLPAAAIQWACALTTASLPERSPFPELYEGLDALLEAICAAPSARGWLAAMVGYEAMLLRVLGYGGTRPDLAAPPEAQFKAFRRLHRPIRDYLLAERSANVMAARTALGERLARIM
ncbi:DNA repair protein RecO [Erythrobacter sp.]|uniref:DNA repair protein RecO n=1 Tax=Erythrobacter sp. TaxID=1042 RepID=UPI002EA94E11|nr:recombination protein O N-terminal domain-containing protein [Erythrobacter sp.]